ncbi:hypothetical protein ABO04_09180 [Nitrosomonas sp. HPC101]|nr:hypothetical protein [Nitrosomonas sp. HPC101]
MARRSTTIGKFSRKMRLMQVLLIAISFSSVRDSSGLRKPARTVTGALSAWEGVRIWIFIVMSRRKACDSAYAVEGA